MNEQNNIAVIQQAFACFGQGDVPGILNTLANDVRWWVAPVANVPYTGARNGHAGAAEFFALMAQCEDVLQFEPRDFIAQGDQVVVRAAVLWVLGDLGARPLDAGLVVQLRVALVLVRQQRGHAGQPALLVDQSVVVPEARPRGRGEQAHQDERAHTRIA